MYERVPYPAEAPVYDDAPSGRCRLPLILFGARSRADASGWTHEERAVARGLHLPGSDRDGYLGPLIPFDPRADSEAQRQAALRSLMMWRYEAVLVPVAGVVIPLWDSYDPLLQQQMAVAARYVLTSRPESDQVLLRHDTALPLLRVDSGKLGPVRPTSPRREENVVDDLQGLAPSREQLMYEVMARVTHQEPTRDFASACRVAVAARAQGRSNAWIRQYLETFGYRNAKGTAGRWQPARLDEAFVGAQR
jgi:hypothetical protein